MSSITGFLGFALINQGWKEIDAQDIFIKGNSYTSKEQIIRSMKFKLPSPLLKINPKQLESNILRHLPIQAISISRRISPLRLHIEILERKPIAIGERLGLNGLEKGMVDREGIWIEIDNSNKFFKDFQKDNDLFVSGWMERHKKWIALIFQYQNQLGSPLRKITLTPNSEISLQTEYFAKINLGSNTSLISNQLEALKRLSNSLPSKFIKDPSTSLDLTDPLNPKLIWPENK